MSKQQPETWYGQLIMLVLVTLIMFAWKACR